MKKIRPFGQISDDMEILIQEMTEDHEMQWGEILGQVLTYLQIHCPDNQELYSDNTVPQYIYAHKETIIEIAERLKNEI